MNSSYFNEHFLNQKKDELIASFFSNDLYRFEEVYRQIYSKINTCKSFDENEQKALNQIQVFILKFKSKIIGPDIIKLNRDIKKKLSNIVRYETKKTLNISFKDWKRKTDLTEKQLEILYKTTTVFQISSGCSNYCRRCNEWALPGVRKHFSFDTIKTISTRLFHADNNDFIYYGASDPLDWEDGKKDVNDIVNFLSENNFTPTYGLLTKVPIGKNLVLENLIQRNTDISISQTNKNRDRVKALETKTGAVIAKQHDDKELLIPAALDEDFTTVKSSITDSYGSEITPDGAYIVIPAFTSILNLTGQKRIPITKNTDYFLLNKTGRRALSISYFKPFEAMNLKSKVFRLNNLLDVQIENILLDNGSESLNPPGMMNLDEFFKTFDTEAVLRKRKILPSIITDLKEKYLKNKKYKKTSQSCKKQYLKHLEDYLTLGNEKKMKILIKFSFSYFLNAIADYLTKNPFKREIILHLKKNDRSILEKKYFNLFSTSDFDQFFEIAEINNFDLFQILSIRLVMNPGDSDIKNFIKKYPAVFDEGTGVFINKFN